MELSDAECDELLQLCRRCLDAFRVQREGYESSAVNQQNDPTVNRLIHPFREGNGRVGRLLLNVMACQAGIGPLDDSA